MSEIIPAEAVQIFALGGTNQEAALFGYKIPFLPDFLADHTLLGESQSDRLDEVLQRFTRLVAGLRKHRGSAFSLRFISRPESGSIEVFFIIRVLCSQGQSLKVIQDMEPGISAHLTIYAIPHQVLDGKTRGLPALDNVIRPFSSSPAVVELRQHEQVVPLLAAGGGQQQQVREGYTIHPFWGPAGSFLEPFETMLQLKTPLMVSIYLEPTQLSNEEYRALSEAAATAQTLADVDLTRYSNTSIHRQRDPGAELVARIYSAYQKSLVDPFILAVQVASPDPNTAWTAARALSSSIGSQALNKFRTSDEQELPVAVDITHPSSADEAQRLAWTMFNLLWYPRSEVMASPEKQRLPYLVGSKGASTAFRFPVSVKGGVPGIEVRQLPPTFEPGPRPQSAGQSEMHLGAYHRGGAVTFPVKEFTRHALISGFTGSGKTNTVVYLLSQLWLNHGIPFLVIEAAKKEYRAMARVTGFEDLLVFTFGDETTSPFRLNPFELLPGVRLEAHLSKLQACFDAALPQFGILPSIVAEALENVYKNRGWKLTDTRKEKEDRLFPTLKDMLAEVIRVTETRGYAGETFHNIRAAAAGRIGNLLRGSRGRTFGTQRSFPAEVIFKRPVILELNDLNEDEKALVMMFILTWLREYREQNRTKALQHVTVVEEAHNVVSNVQSVGASEISADTKAKAVSAFANMLAEVRAYGEGLIISDQSPEKLAPDAVRNTNIQIIHQLRDRRDREAMARAMLMDDRQQEYLGKLRVGEAAYFRTGLEKATFIQIPEYKDSAGFDDLPEDAWVSKRMETFRKKYSTSCLPFDGCRFCPTPCSFREFIEPQTMVKEIHEQFISALKRFDQSPGPESWEQNWQEVAKACWQAARAGQQPASVDAAFCYLAHEIDFPFTRHMRVEFEKAFMKLPKG